jgi:acyl phosphate:glycerol-3-phosphate acyltransferase
MYPALGVAAAYLLGSIPSAYIAGKLLKGIDLRQHGSGNLGATNVYRVLGAKVAIAVLLFDTAKGAVPVWLFSRSVPADQRIWWAIAFGVAAILGHVRSAFLGWKGGGKGVATAGGVFLALAPAAMLAALGAWLVVAVSTGYVSLASLTAATVLPIALVVTKGVRSPLTALAALVAAFVFWTHRANIGRLRRGEESRFGRKDKTPRPDTGDGRRNRGGVS